MAHCWRTVMVSPSRATRHASRATQSYADCALLAQRADLGAWIARREDCNARHERVGTRAPALADRLARDATVDLERRATPRLLQQETRAANLVERIRNEFLTAEARI